MGSSIGSANEYGPRNNQPMSELKETGSFYTPIAIAREITQTTIAEWLSEKENCPLKSLKEARILDPSVGDGVFLVSAGHVLQELRQYLGDTTEVCTLRKEIVESSLFGVDLQSSAIGACKENLVNWVQGEDEEFETNSIDISNIRVGNSLLGEIGNPSSGFVWAKQYPSVFNTENPGFDIVLGNPPYGNLLSENERAQIADVLSYPVYGNRKGTWNVAALFIVRAWELLRAGGHLGFLIPNSVLRVGQFQKTREFILERMKLYKITDEGNPFTDVTLEMVSIFCKAEKSEGNHLINIESKREDLAMSDYVRSNVFSSGRIFSIYHDQIYDEILEKGTRGLLNASRGRDIPHSNVRKKTSTIYSVPYITTGRSVKRYFIDKEHLRFSNDWFKRDSALTESYSNSFLVATKNYPYPRCVMKPKGVIHGGGIVKIAINDSHLPDEAIGLILNSQLMKYICIKYLTNYSELTTCLNTGIIEEVPIVSPKYPRPFNNLFVMLQEAHTNRIYSESVKIFLENAADALIYSLYFDEIENLEGQFHDCIIESSISNPCELHVVLNQFKQEIESVLETDIVKSIAQSPRIS